MTSGPGGEPGRDRWLLSFADLLTLLFAFMLVLYASTAFNNEQQRELGQSLRTSFGGTPASPTAVEALSERLRPELARLLILEVLKVEEDPHFLRLVINSRMLFPPGAVAINDRYDTLLGFLVTQVEALPLRLTVEGHTANAPVFSGPFSTNLALSAARGTAVGERLLSLGLPSSALSVAGFGAERPVADNDSPEGRARNRRIVLRLEPVGTD